jgi:hypothetical protein
MLSAILAFYVAGYVILGQKLDASFADPFARPSVERVFAARWQATAFIPAALIESKTAGMSVSLYVGYYDGQTYRSMVEAWRLDP